MAHILLYISVWEQPVRWPTRVVGIRKMKRLRVCRARFYTPQKHDNMTISRTDPFPIQEFGGLNLYAFVGNNSVAEIDRVGLVGGYGNPVSGPNGPVDPGYAYPAPVQFPQATLPPPPTLDYCSNLKNLIDNQEANIRSAIKSMGDVNQMFDSTMQTQWAALGIEGFEAWFGSGVMREELVAFREAPWTFHEGLKTAIIVGVFGTVVEEGSHKLANAGVEALTGFDFLNPANTMAESQEEMSQHVSESSYDTIKELQAQLAKMLDEYRCKCKK